MPEPTDRERGAAVFADPDVAASYHGRAPYPNAMYATLLAQVPGRRRALDIGAGPGKIARVLADHFAEVVALDPSAAMIAVGKADDACAHPNIAWVQERAEDYHPADGFDLATAGASIHWPVEAILFPKLVEWTPLIAIVNGEPVFPHPAPPCGPPAWLDFLNRWRRRIDRPPILATEAEPPIQPGGPHEAWMDVAGRERFRYAYRQSIEAFIANNHARIAWHRATIGRSISAAFDAELDALMRPFADDDGMLMLDAVCDLTWGTPRSAPR